MLKAACLLLILYGASHTPAQTPSAAQPVTKHDQAVRELKELTFNECEAVLENHTATLDRIWADEFTMHTADDVTTPKAGARAYLRTALPQSISGVCTIEYQEIKVSGNKAKMSGRMRISATDSDGSFKPVQYRFGQRLVKREGSWQVVFLEFSFDK
ncbi:MAG TPA: nuclear transport factor 2 family protein [Pyrinomonadaceae bacterium]|nr:nuclear transport factor 2 family protein [Pyrinomonadaceae bacterium]